MCVCNRGHGPYSKIVSHRREAHTHTHIKAPLSPFRIITFPFWAYPWERKNGKLKVQRNIDVRVPCVCAPTLTHTYTHIHPTKQCVTRYMLSIREKINEEKKTSTRPLFFIFETFRETVCLKTWSCFVPSKNNNYFPCLLLNGTHFDNREIYVCLDLCVRVCKMGANLCRDKTRYSEKTYRSIMLER